MESEPCSLRGEGSLDVFSCDELPACFFSGLGGFTAASSLLEAEPRFLDLDLVEEPVPGSGGVTVFFGLLDLRLLAEPTSAGTPSFSSFLRVVFSVGEVMFDVDFFLAGFFPVAVVEVFGMSWSVSLPECDFLARFAFGGGGSSVADDSIFSFDGCFRFLNVDAGSVS